MAKFLGNVVVIEQTNLPALFYYRHLLENRKGNPVYYFDEIDKAGIDKIYSEMSEYPTALNFIVEEVQEVITEVAKTVYHGYRYTVAHENVKDEGLAKKQAQTIQKMIKEHQSPYNDAFKRYTVSILQG